MKKLTLGARGSKLSLIQTEIVKVKLQKILPKTEITVKVIKTKGDRDMNPVPLDTIGKGWFTSEIDKQLLEGKIDLAVHSLKDLPEEMEKGLGVSTILDREDPRDVLLSRNNLTLENLRRGAIVGTDSTRRGSQILNKRPDVIIQSLRGNVNTRITKLEDGDYDAIVLAAAGLKRLGLEEKITQYFEADEFIPAPGQGALAVVTTINNKELNRKVKEAEEKEVLACVKAERAFSYSVGGGCKTPVGAYAVCDGLNLTLYGFLGTLDGTKSARGSVKGKMSEAGKLGKNLAVKLLKISEGWYEISE